MYTHSEDLAPVARTTGLVVRELDGEMLVYDRTRDTAHALNRMNAAVWKRCDGVTSVADMVEQIGAEFDQRISESSVFKALAELGRYRLLEEEAPAPSRRGMSRRTMLIRSGVTVATIPVITRLALPEGVASATCTCTASGPCVVGTCPDNSALSGCHQGQACSHPGTSGTAASGCCGNPSGRAGCCGSCGVCGICSNNVCQVGSTTICQSCTG